MAVILLPTKFIIALGLNNSSKFLTGFYCFELRSDVDIMVIAQILENQFNLRDCYYYDFNRRMLEENNDEIISQIKQKAKEHEESEHELIRRGEYLECVSEII